MKIIYSACFIYCAVIALLIHFTFPENAEKLPNKVSDLADYGHNLIDPKWINKKPFNFTENGLQQSSIQQEERRTKKQ